MLPLCATWRHFVRSSMPPAPSVPLGSARWLSPACHAATGGAACPVEMCLSPFCLCSIKFGTFPCSLEERQPWVYLSCGHVHGRHDWGQRSEGEQRRGEGVAPRRECPLCRSEGPYVPLWLGSEPAVYLDAGPPTHGFVPCGHVCSERTARYWAEISLPHGTHAFRPVCPFCSAALSTPGWTRLIFQGPID